MNNTTATQPVNGESAADQINAKTCPICLGHLYKKHVVNITTRQSMGHYWWCNHHELAYVGWGEPCEYDGTPKASSKEAADAK